MSNPPLLSQDELDKNLTELNANAQEPWDITDGRLHRKYKFDSFSDAVGFMMQSSLECEILSHHPKWTNVWNVVEIDLLTHRSSGITHLDFDLAKRMEPLAAKLLTE